MIGTRTTVQSAQNIATVIHDIASPVTLIRLNLDLLENQMEVINTNSKLKTQALVLKRYLKRAITGVEKVTKILNFSATIQYNQYKIEAFNTKTEIKNVINTFEIRCLSQDVNIKLFSNCDLKIQGSKQAFHKVLGNIISNSLDAYLQIRTQLKKTIWINCFKSGDYLTITFEDNAGGIPSTIQRYLFKQQFTTKTNGSGLGLISIKKLVEEHFLGFINCYSIKNQGALFAIALPLSK